MSKKRGKGVNPGQGTCCECVNKVHIIWLLRAVTAAGGQGKRGRRPEKETGSKGEQRWVGVVIDGGKRTSGRAMAGKEDGRRVGGGRAMKCVPGFQLQASPVVLGWV